MAFETRKLGVLAYAHGFTLYVYRTDNDLLNDVSDPGFLVPAADVIRRGDVIMVSAADGARTVVVRTAYPDRVVTAPLT